MVTAKLALPRLSTRSRLLAVVIVAAMLCVLAATYMQYRKTPVPIPAATDMQYRKTPVPIPAATETHRFEVDNFLTDNAVWSADGGHVLSSSNFDRLTVYDVADGTKQQFGVADLGSAEWVATSADGSIAVTAGRRVHVWNAKTWELQRTIPSTPDNGEDFSTSSDRVAVSANGRNIAVLYNRLYRKHRGTVGIFDSQTGQELTVIKIREAIGDVPLSLAFSPDGTRLATGGYSTGTANVWDVETGAQLLTLQGAPNMVSDIAWSPDGKHIATANDHDKGMIWNAQTGELIRTVAVEPPLPERDQIRTSSGAIRFWTTSVDWSPDSSLVAFGLSDTTVGIWDVASGDRKLAILQPALGNSEPYWNPKILSVEFSPDGEKLAIAIDDKSIRVWDVRAAYE